MFAISLFATAADGHQKGRAFTLQSQLGGPVARTAGMLVCGVTLPPQGRSYFGVPPPLSRLGGYDATKVTLGGLPIAFKTSENKAMDKIMRRLI